MIRALGEHYCRALGAGRPRCKAAMPLYRLQPQGLHFSKRSIDAGGDGRGTSRRDISSLAGLATNGRRRSYESGFYKRYTALVRRERLTAYHLFISRHAMLSDSAWMPRVEKDYIRRNEMTC